MRLRLQNKDTLICTSGLCFKTIASQEVENETYNNKRHGWLSCLYTKFRLGLISNEIEFKIRINF